MDTHSRIVVTGAQGFIGRNVVEYLRSSGFDNLVLIDRENKNSLLEDFDSISPALVIHLGASVNTGDADRAAIMQNNFEYSKALFDLCVRHNTRLVYASSAATYGDGSKGFSDMRRDLLPRNPYAESKHMFDEFVRDAPVQPPQCIGLKFFNVYGPYESHKGRMASTVLFSYQQAKEEGVIKLFRSHNPQYKDGEQMRDFIYVKDIVSIIGFFMEHPEISGIFNAGTGAARTFLDLARAVFTALGQEQRIEFIDTPEQFRSQYQYFTEADITHLRSVGYEKTFTSLEEGVRDYVVNYLEKGL